MFSAIYRNADTGHASWRSVLWARWPSAGPPPHLDSAAHYDAVVAMFHDQGLPVLKHASFGGGVNVTLGLPIIRTSVDHGTALDLAGTGRADPGSLFAAVELAITSNVSVFGLLEGAPFQKERQLFTDKFNRIFPINETPIYGRGGLTLKF